MDRKPELRDNQWIPSRNNDSWTLHMFPFTLKIDLRPREALPYVGSLVGKTHTLGEFHSWATDAEAIAGMIEWGLAELSESYHDLAKLRIPQQGVG